MAMESYTSSLFRAGPKSRLEPTRFVQKVAEENNRTMSFGEKGLFICGNIYLGKQLLNCAKHVRHGPDHHFQDQWLGVETCYLIFLHPALGVSRSVWRFKYGNGN